MPWCIHIVPLQANSSPKTKFEEVYQWNSSFFLVNHRDELTGRCKMKLKKWFLWFLMTFICFPDILGRNRVKLPEFGGHRTEFGGGHKKPSSEIWFETEHFEILSFRAPGSDFRLFTSWAWNDPREKFSWILVIFQVDMESTRRDEENPEIVSKTEKFGFLANFAQNWVFAKT